MYSVAVPMTINTLYRSEREKIIAQLKAAKVERIFLALGIYHKDEQKRKDTLALLREECAIYKEAGFKVSAWNWTFQFPYETEFTRMTSIDGVESAAEVCPADPAFRAYAADYVAEIAAAGVDMLLFDDDYRFTPMSICQPCTCAHHLKLTEKYLGRPVTREEIAAVAIKGPKNPVRSAWQRAKSESLLQFAREMRAAVDKVNPEMRLGVCACMGSWDVDGIDAATISRTLAGNTKPFLRLIGAPYWAVKKSWGNRMQDVIELHRMERSWCGDGIEICGEGDAFPRPRYTCPASYLEGFDIALRADGRFDGILKYMNDYISSQGYESGYYDRHCRNLPLYPEIEEIFGSKPAVGIRVYEALNKYEEGELIETPPKGDQVYYYFFSPAARMLAANAVPTVYEGSGCCGIAFGENARHLPEGAFDKGLILDARAAQILEELGIDTGLAALGEPFLANEEYFPAYEEYTRIGGFPAPTLRLKEGAEVLSFYRNAEGAQTPGSYFYKNAKGQRFFVLGFNGYFGDEFFYRNYMRGRQIAALLPRLSGEQLPAFCGGNPDLYLMAKESEQGMAVGLWNFHADSVFAPKVVLKKEYKKIRFIRCSGSLEGNVVTLSELAAFGFCGFEVMDEKE